MILTPEESRKILSNLILFTAKRYFFIGLYSGLLIGWIAGAMVMLWLQ